MAERLVNPAEADVAATDRMPEIKDHNLGPDLRYVGGLIKSYLKNDPIIGWGLVLLKIAITVAMSFAGLTFQVGLAKATNALTQNNAAAAWQGISLAGLMIAAMFVAMLCSTIAEFVLRMRMRTVYTKSFLVRWLAGNKFFHLERAGGIDHPEQRIQEDIFVYAQMFMTLAPTLLGTCVSVVLYFGTLWNLSPPVSLAFVGLPYTIHGYLPFIAIISGAVMTLIVHWIGDALTKAEITRQRLEAHFRNDMAGVRENAEMVAFEKGEEVEKARLFEIFDLIRRNWRRYTFAQARLGAVLGLPPMVLVVAPMALCAPLILAGRMGLGDMQLVSGSFLIMYMSVSVIATSYREIAIMRSAVARMRFFDEALERTVLSDIRVREVPEATIVTQALQLRFPDGQPMVQVGDIKLSRGDRLLVRGPSGVGKSTLLRALAGLWPFGSGEVVLPATARVCFLPQRGYMPDGTLAALLSYPKAPEVSRDDEYRSVLRALKLEALVPSLHRHDQWRKILSPGEQQRVAAARALLSKPDFLFLDEATSALDPHSETTLYTLLDEQLPNAAIISVAHRPDVARFHKDVLDLADGSVHWSALQTTQ